LGFLPMFNIHLYGSVGIIISEVVYTFPQVFLILFISLASADYRLYEAADVLGAGSLRKFFTVTLPNIRYAIFSSIFVCFTMSFVDFGAPKIVGGQFNVLATDVYKQVVGQHNMTMGATVGMILLLPAVISFIIDRVIQKKQQAGLTSKSTPYQITPKRDRDILFFVGCLLVAGAIVFLNFTILFASFIKAWPYDLSLTAVNYNFSGVSSHGLGPYYNSLIAASFTAILGTVITFTNAYVIEKLRPLSWLRQATYAMSLLPMALPGIVIGLSYAFFFNKLTFDIPIIGIVENPFNWLYGTMAIIILANVFHYYSVPFITATTALKKLDNEFELVSESMAVPFYKTFFSVSVPISILAIMEIMMYYFVTAMVTVSAVIFLYTSETKLSSVAIVSMEDNGDISSAAAMSMLIIITNIVVRIIYELSTRVIRKKTMAWQKPKEM
jgi:iron(III) transport system permease protein